MQKSIIRTATALAGCILIAAGCIQRSSIIPDGRPISFAASSLLRNDATKSGSTPKTEFAPGDIFYVFGQHGTATPLLFDKTQVSFDGSAWNYSPLRFWDWAGADDEYNFLAITGPEAPEDIEYIGSTPLRARVTAYRPTESQYDLMAAAAHRSDGSIGQVTMDFRHLLSSVSVTVINDTEDKSLTLYSVGFQHIAAEGSVSVQQNGNDVTSSWGTLPRNGSVILGYSTEDGNHTIPPGGSYPEAGITDLMIPQSLNPLDSSKPALILDYAYHDDDLDQDVRIPDVRVRLEEIRDSNSNGYILAWTPGVKYHYEIHIRLGGGVRVRVITTQWDVVNAETPGLTI